jgi:hypothetical protein
MFRNASAGSEFAISDDPLSDRCYDTLGDLLLDRKNIIYGPVVPLAPEISARRTVKKLRRDAKPISGAPHTAFNHVLGAEQTPDLAHIQALTTE